MAFKHGGRRDLAEPLGIALAHRLAGLGWPSDTAVTGVPLHPARRMARGYDQAAQLARVVARELGLPYIPALRRRCHTAPQGSPGGLNRWDNVRDIFALLKVGTRSRWILIDDVASSLATVREAANTLGAPSRCEVHLGLLARAQERHLALPLDLRDHSHARFPPPA